MSEIILLLIIILVLYLVYGFLVLNSEKRKKNKSKVDSKENNSVKTTENLEFEEKSPEENGANGGNVENGNKEQFNGIDTPYEFPIPKTVNPFGEDKPYNEKLKEVQKYYKFNNKPYYKLGKSWRKDYTYDWCGAKGQQPIDAIQYNDLSFMDKKQYKVIPNKYFLKN